MRDRYSAAAGASPVASYVVQLGEVRHRGFVGRLRRQRLLVCHARELVSALPRIQRSEVDPNARFVRVLRKREFEVRECRARVAGAQRFYTAVAVEKRERSSIVHDAAWIGGLKIGHVEVDDVIATKHESGSGRAHFHAA
jgi:hypothetical protein